LFFDNEIVYKKTKTHDYEETIKKKINSMSIKSVNSKKFKKGEKIEFRVLTDTFVRMSCHYEREEELTSRQDTSRDDKKDKHLLFGQQQTKNSSDYEIYSIFLLEVISFLNFLL